MRHSRKLGIVAILLICGASWAPCASKMLSSQADTKDSDPLRASRSSDEATGFWGVAGVLGGSRTTPPADVGLAKSAVQSYAKKSGLIYSAAFLLSVKGRSDVIGELAKSRERTDTALAAAALVLGALGEQLQAERTANKVVVTHFDSSGQELKLKKAGGKGRNKKNTKAAGRDPALAAHVGTLLTSRDPLTLYLAIQAAAYAKEASVSESVAAVASANGKIAAAKLFYRAMIGETLTKEEIIAATNLAGRNVSRSMGRRTALQPNFDVDLPGLCFICKAVGIAGGELAGPILRKSYASGDPRIQIDALRAIAKLELADSLPILAEAVTTAPWYVLIDACRAAGMIPSEKMIPVLIKRLSKEKGRMRLDLTHALSSIVGSQEGSDAKQWASWWSKNGASFSVDPAASKAYREKTRPQDVDMAGLGFFYGLNLYSDHFSYVVDSSASMKGDRIASLKENMTGSIEGLAEFVNYNIVDFGGDIEVMYPGALTSDSRKGKQHVYDMDMSVATRSFCALRQAMRLEDLDTVFFLSDGAPAIDSVKGWYGIIRGILLMTRYCPVAMYCIDFDPSAGNQASMIMLADENFGLHESVEVGPANEEFDLGGAAKKRKGKRKK